MKRSILALSILAAGNAAAFDQNYAVASVTVSLERRPVLGVAFTLRHGNGELRAAYDMADRWQLGAGLTNGDDITGAAGAAYTSDGFLPYVALAWSPTSRDVVAGAVSYGTVRNYAMVGTRYGHSQTGHDPAPVATHVDNTALPPISTEPVPPGATGPQTPPVASGEGIDPSADPVLTGPGTGAPPPEPVTDPVTGETIQPAPAPTCPAEPAPAVGGVVRNGFDDGTAPGQGADHANGHAPAGTLNPNRSNRGA